MEAVILPKNIELEQNILGSLLIDKNVIPLVIGMLKEEVFYDLKHQRIFRTLNDMYNRNIAIDITTVAQMLSNEQSLSEVGGAYYLSKLTDSIVRTNHLNTHIAMAVELYKKRQAYFLFKQSEAECLDMESEVLDLLSTVNSKLIGLQEFGNIYEKTIDQIVLAVIEKRDMAQKGELLGFNTGFTELNHTIAGWCKPDMIIVAARPGAGKTAMMLSSIYHLAILNSVPTAIFSLEMSSEQLVERLESIVSQVPLKRLRTNNMNEYEKLEVMKADDKILQSPIYIDDTGGISIQQLRAKATVMKQKYGIKVIFIDYLQLMTANSKQNQNREQEVSTISRSLKALAKELEVPIIALSQLSRRVEERADKMPQLSDLRESGSLEQDADIVIMLMRPSYYEMTEPVTIGGTEYDSQSLVICKVEKNRHGVTKNIPLRFIGETVTFENNK
ncbi:MAG: replicative helicase [Bacteroidota bacterium]|jgi:replicative DNA helicase